MRKKIKHIFWQHWNCLPWVLCGISVLIDGEVEMYLCFVCVIDVNLDETSV